MQNFPIPDRLIERCSDAGFDATRSAVRQAHAFVACPNALLLVLSGGPGAGKTLGAVHAALGARAPDRVEHYRDGDGVLQAVRFTGRPLSAAFVTASQLTRVGQFERALWSELEGVDLLIIDDLGAEPLEGSPYALANLASVLVTRENEGLKTMMTTNYGGGQFKDTYCKGPGERVLSRLRQYPGSFFAVDEKDMRLGGANGGRGDS